MTKKVIDTKLTIVFIIGLITYLAGLFLLFWSVLTKCGIIKFVEITNNILNVMKITGIFMFVIGFVLFILSIIMMYKQNKIVENNRDLLVEGKADVITIIVMTYIMIIMLVLCLIFNQVIGALLFGVTIILQSIINSVLIRYFNKRI